MKLMNPPPPPPSPSPSPSGRCVSVWLILLFLSALLFLFLFLLLRLTIPSFPTTITAFPCIPGDVNYLSTGKVDDLQLHLLKERMEEERSRKGEKEEYKWSYMHIMRRRKGRRRKLGGPGSSPPRCTSKCGKCTPCKPVHVPVPPGTPVTAEYYPEAWRCKCGNKLYMP